MWFFDFFDLSAELNASTSNPRPIKNPFAIPWCYNYLNLCSYLEIIIILYKAVFIHYKTCNKDARDVILWWMLFYNFFLFVPRSRLRDVTSVTHLVIPCARIFLLPPASCNRRVLLLRLSILFCRCTLFRAPYSRFSRFVQEPPTNSQEQHDSHIDKLLDCGLQFQTWLRGQRTQDKVTVELVNVLLRSFASELKIEAVGWHQLLFRPLLQSAIRGVAAVCDNALVEHVKLSSWPKLFNHLRRPGVRVFGKLAEKR